MMSIQWTLTAAFLYAEILFITLMLLPIIPTTRWKQIFKWSSLRLLSVKTSRIFNTAVVVLGILLIDSIRHLVNFGKNDKGYFTTCNSTYNNTDVICDLRAQRNFYITGMALFLSFFIRRLILLICDNANLEEEITIARNEVIRLENSLEDVVEIKVREREKKSGLITPPSEKILIYGENDTVVEPPRSRSRSRVKKET